MYNLQKIGLRDRKKRDFAAERAVLSVLGVCPGYRFVRFSKSRDNALERSASGDGPVIDGQMSKNHRTDFGSGL
jgi:hypothetical protein